MRTTVTLDPDAEQLIRQRMRERNLTFKEALNEAIRQGSLSDAPRFRTSVVSMGRPAVPLDRALQLAGNLEDEELIRRMRAGE